VLQEVMVSNALQFVRCRASELSALASNQSYWTSSSTRLIESLVQFWMAWNSFEGRKYDLLSVKQQYPEIRFLNAFIFDGLVTRVPYRGDYKHIAFANSLKAQMFSKQRSTKPRDYIPAVLPQHHFYVIPWTARDWSFGDLFLNCLRQFEMQDSQFDRMSPFGECPPDRIIKTNDNMAQVPERTCQGDMVKWFYCHPVPRFYNRWTPVPPGLISLSLKYGCFAPLPTRVYSIRHVDDPSFFPRVVSRPYCNPLTSGIHQKLATSLTALEILLSFQDWCITINSCEPAQY